MSPDELSALLHKEGINIRYLKEVYLKVSDSFMKSMIASEMVARSIKAIFRKTMQDECFEAHQTTLVNLTEEEYAVRLKEKCVDFMNCIFGAGGESEAIWELIAANL